METLDILRYLHTALDRHFRKLTAQRTRLEPASPVFALEHGLSETELEMLNAAVKTAVRSGFTAEYRQPWLPLVVYSAEIGYGYVGDEYWPSFVQATPGWDTNSNRPYFRSAFSRFADEYGGARPTGAWAHNFPIICWPITHAVLPVYLQRQLAQLLFEYRTGLTTALLCDPQELGVRLAARTANYAERFRIFCQNTSLLGQIATALLLGDEDSPHLLKPTLHRLVQGLEAEQQGRVWLRDARRFASQIRYSGTHARAADSPSRQRRDRLPNPTDPRLFLRRTDQGWVPYAALPDLAPLQARLPHLFDELRTSRAEVNGHAGKLSTGRLTYPGQEVRLASWPRSDTPFIQLERASTQANALMASQCVVSPGPWWVFHIRRGAPAIQVKGAFLRPGHSYCLVCRADTTIPDLPWIKPATLLADGAKAVEACVPDIIDERDVIALNSAGLATLSDVEVRPVGLVAASWDGDRTAEWLVGEPVMLAIRAERRPERCVLTIGGSTYVLEWPEQSPELLVGFDRLAAGSHDIEFDLLGADGGKALADGSFRVVLREPQMRAESATFAEGIRLLAAPARPLLTDLWDSRAHIVVEGPPDTPAELSLVLRDADGHVLERIRRRIELPMSAETWTKLARQLRSTDIRNNYDAAESCEVSVSRAGVGFATLSCDRGFQPLRWILTRHDRVRVAQLVDRTDGENTLVEYLPVSSPLVGQKCNGTEVELPPLGGLLQAKSGNTTASIILPPDRNEFRSLARLRPRVRAGPRTVLEVTRLLLRHHDWSAANLPADPFAEHQRIQVLDAITRCLVSLVAGSKWSRLESSLDSRQVADRLDEMQTLVGESADREASIAELIAANLWRWADSPRTRTEGFADSISTFTLSIGLGNRPDIPGFLLKLANSPGRLATWDAADRAMLIGKVLRFPVLIRAARFAVLGSEAFSTQADVRFSEGESA